MQLSLEIKAKQQLSISPQLQHAIRLLQLSTLELQAEIQDAIERNPLLELEEPETRTEISEFLTTTSITTISIKRMTDDDFDDEDPFSNTKSTEDLTGHLIEQLNLLNLSDEDYTIGLVIIDAINQDGYLTQNTTEIAATALQNDINANATQIEAVLEKIQNFEPTGVGARTVDECILLQLQKNIDQSETSLLACQIISDYFELFSKRDYKKICSLANIHKDQFLAALQLIQSTNPRPGADFSELIHHYVIPDVYVRKYQNTWRVFLNPQNILSPKINNKYLSILKNSKNKTDIKYIKENLKEAKWFITSIENRNSTLLKVANAIMDYQLGFLENGAMAMKPLRLLTIAQSVEVHESTISRITSQKYIDTPHGVFELKHFFSSQVQSDDGSTCSSTAIKALIKKIVDEEKKHKPHSDNMIAKLLRNEGINIARRTVTKYREAMGVLCSTERKSNNFSAHK